VVALDWSTCARDRAGAVRCWGAGDRGQLGVGAVDTAAPGEAVPLPGPATALTAGETHACALTADGCAWCWGDDRKGQLGDGRIPTTDAVVGVRPVLLSCR